MARFTQSSTGGSGNSNTTLIKDFVWGYPTPNAVAIEPITQSQSIALKSSGGASLRWHIRDGGQSLATNFSLEAVSIIEQSGEMGVGPYQVKFYIGTQESLMPVGYHYTVNDGGPWAGSYISTASTIDTLTLEYPGPDVPGANEDFTGGTIYVPSVYNQVEVNEDGAWIKNTNWSEPNGYANYWQFANDGSIHFPYNTSNSRTGSGDVLKFATSIDQAIIATGETTSSNPTASRLVIAGADGYTGTTGEGGDIYLWAGRGGDAGGSGGDIKIDGGDSYTTGEGGTVKVRGGYSTGGTGGFVEIFSGSSNTGNGGPIDIVSGYSSSGTGGNINITAQSNGKITLSGSAGEFLNDSSNANNQIATIGDIAAGTDTYDILYTTHNGDGTNIQIGDDAWIGDINAANYLGIKGVQDPTLGGIVFGSLGLTSITTDSTNLSLSANNDIVLNPGSSYAYIGTPQIDGSNRIAKISDLIPGAQGDPGADGDSAYQVAVTNGFVGTEAEWLASLVGPAGADGTGSTTASTVQHSVKAGVALTKGQAVYVSSADGTNMIVSKSSNTGEGTSSKTMGLIDSDLSLNGIGNVITEGLLAGLDTSTANAGDPVWLGTNGNLIFGLANKPVAPAHLVFIGVVTRVQQNNGEIFVKVQNGFEIEELHDVLIGTGYASTPTDNDILAYDSASGLWKNQTASEAGLVVEGGSATFVDVTTSGQLKTQQTQEMFNSYSTSIGSGATVTLDCSSGNVFVITSTVSGNWTANLTNLNLSSGYATDATLLITQGATGYIPNALQIGGVAQTINWQGGVVPTPNANKKDIVALSILNDGGTYTVFGQLVTFG